MRDICKRIGERKAFYIVMLIGCFLRLFYIGNIPGNCALYVDEIFSGYESWSHLHYGVDYLGYHFPVYLPVWGGGMSIMQAMCQMPFIAVFGPTSFALRLPAAILGCITIYAFYYICKNIGDEKFALLSAFLLSVMPWHIMQSRWALDCNYFVGFITISVALLIKASENNKFFPLAAGFLGLTLYTYALPWVVMPLFVAGAIAYLLYCKKIRFDRYLFIGIAVLAVLAVPLLLFVMVNYGIISEIRTPVISIPKLSHFRSDELSLSPKAMIKRLYDTLVLFVSQDDGRVSDVTPMFGLYYKFSNVLILIGIAICITEAWKSLKERKTDYGVLITLLFICAMILGSTTEIFFSRINIIHIPMTFFLVKGVWFLIEILGDKALRVAVGVYGCCCIAFLMYYFTYHDDNVAFVYLDGAKSSLEYVDTLYDNGTASDDAIVHIVSGLSFTHVLFYEQYPTKQFIEDVRYADLSDVDYVMTPLSFGKYDFESAVLGKTDYEYQSGDVYICESDDSHAKEFMKENGLQIEYLGNLVVGY